MIRLATLAVIAAAVLTPTIAHANVDEPLTTTDGTLLVPSEIARGNYRVDPLGEVSTWETCNVKQCDSNTDSDNVIGSGWPSGVGHITIGPGAAAITLYHIRLTPEA